MANRLALETSPYLLQHADNPVDWYPWGPEALGRATAEDRPILLSIGYSACHWCHVMERESFEDEETAALMNEHFVCVKVDREERPDVDAIYMEAVQAMTGHGGWPLTAFLDTGASPFYCGTYYPPEPRHGMPSFRMVLEAVVASWQTKRAEISAQAGRIRERLEATGEIEPAAGAPSPALLAQAEQRLVASADPVNGGFGGAPKFPPASAIEFLLARGEREVAARALDGMLAGGICDQIGGGFSRYAVDAIWLVPHFEKMLYDNALLARAYLHGFQALGHDRWREACERTLEWMLRELRGPEGGFASALDADSEGVEGRFYVWSADELRRVLGEAGLEAEADALASYWGVTAGGNFEGQSILHLAGGAESVAPAGLGRAREALYEHRANRVWPGLDDKRITSWNALAIAALAEAGAVLGRQDFLDAARAAAGFVWESLRDPDGRLLRTWKDGEGKLLGYLEDHAYVVEAFLVLYESTFEERWFAAARETADSMIERFADSERGGFFTTAVDGERLIVRKKDVDDHPIPSGNSSAAYGLVRLAAITGEHRYAEHAHTVFQLFGRVAENHPQAVGHLLRAIDFELADTKEVALVGADLGELAAVVRSELRPHLVLAGGPEGATEPPLLAERKSVGGRPAAYVCEGFACRAPTTENAELAAALSS
ncbi:MAG: thioredoxin domain-containing protein [Actinomycetota bacterium]|nr:thioredoxin domain-containing protein [Actinomycetota bacterium]